MSTKYLFICAVLLLATSPGALAQKQPGEAMSKYLPSIVQIYADVGTAQVAGTGFFISENGDILTAYHVIRGARSLQIVSSSGSFSTYRLKMYDNSLDLAVLSVRLPAGLHQSFLRLGRLPSALTTRTGYVLGHPDMKQNFAIHVTFPRDSTILSSQWSSLSGKSGARRFVFSAKREVNLIAIDGTLNHGMSGGPVIVDGAVIGIFSGGEEESGGGLGWAISAEYLEKLPPAPEGATAANLPELTLLADSSADLQTLKAVKTALGSDTFGVYLRIDESLKRAQYLASSAQENAALLSRCQRPTAKLNRADSKCINGALVPTELYYSYSDLAVAKMDAIDKGLNRTNDALVARHASITTQEAKQGAIRVFASLADECHMEQLSNMFRLANHRIAEIGNKLVAQHYPLSNQKQDTAHLLDKNAPLMTDSNKELIENLVAFDKAITDWSNEYIKWLIPARQCFRVFQRAIDFQADPAREDEHVDTQKLNTLERVWFYSFGFGMYAGHEAILIACKPYAPVRAEKALSDFRSRNLVFYERVQEGGISALGDSEWQEIGEQVKKMRTETSSSIVKLAAAAGLTPAEACEGLVGEFVEGRVDLASFAPDVVEVVLDERVERKPAATLQALISDWAAKEFAIAVAKDDSQVFNAASLSRLMQELAPVAAAEYARQQLLLCEQSADEALGPADREMLPVAKKLNVADLNKARERAQTYVGTIDAEKLWQAISKYAFSRKMSIQKSLRIEASTLAGECRQIISRVGNKEMYAGPRAGD
ncbi:S1 family peptidase [Paraburkholderia dilworthii]|uniref:S1 family peptidase n=1 Tax=Paraburkholderia dilworthii TaxID=948106 RepID=UPI00040DD57A|nr:serine protease [Paraburkholderia dilworthii]